MPSPHKRTWILERLDREQVYLLWLDPVAFRWEVQPTTVRPTLGLERADALAADATGRGEAGSDVACTTWA